MSIDFKHASELILPSIIDFLPPGKIVGSNEYVTGNPTRDDTHKDSFAVNLTTGKWKDNARPGDCGGDAVSLYAYLHGLTQGDAAKEIFQKYCPDYFEPAAPKKTGTGQYWDGWRLCTRGHKDPPELVISEKKITEWGNVVEKWELRDRNIIAWIVRFQPIDEKKTDYPFTLWTKGGEYKWRSAGFKNEAKYPLWNCEELFARPNDMVVLCEGQKVPSRLKPVIGDTHVCVGWYGGAGNIEMSNLEPLRGREIIFPFDADLAGRKVLKILRDLDIKVHVVYPPVGCEKGWDIADGISEGWDNKKIIDYLSNWDLPQVEPQKQVGTCKFDEPEYLDNTLLHLIFIAQKYPNDGFFCYDGIPYSWNGLYWEMRGMNQMIEEFNQWAYHSPAIFKQAVYNYNLSQDNPNKYIDAQIISEKAARNIKSFRGFRELGSENPFSQLRTVRPYWNFPNGMLEIKSNGVTWYARNENSEAFFMEKYPMGCMGFEYDASAKGAPLFESTVNRLLPDGQKDIKGLNFILQTFAYSLLPVKLVPHYFVCYGLQGSGKSSLCMVLRELAGNYFIAKAMKDIFKEFGKASLIGKLIAYDDDIPDDYVLPAEIKKLSDGSESSINQKSVAHYQAVLNVAPWIVGNKPPQTTGSDGHGRRAVIMHFTSTAPRDPMHMQKMFGKVDGYKDERPAIMNLVLEQLPILIKNDYEFDRPQWAKEDQAHWLSTNNSVSSFFNEMTQKDKSKDRHIWYARTIVHAAYRAWAKSSGYKTILSKTAFYESLPGEGIESKRSANGDVVLCHFEIPKIDFDDRHILKISEDGGTEKGDDNNDSSIPFT